jgi:transposase
MRWAYFVERQAVRKISRDLRVSRKTVRKAVRQPGPEFRYERAMQPRPRLGAFVERLDDLLAENVKRPWRERLTAQRLFGRLQAEGYAGAYDSVQRHVQAWRRAHGRGGDVFIPLWFAPGEAY